VGVSGGVDNLDLVHEAGNEVETSPVFKESVADTGGNRGRLKEKSPLVTDGQTDESRLDIHLKLDWSGSSLVGVKEGIRQGLTESDFDRRRLEVVKSSVITNGASHPSKDPRRLGIDLKLEGDAHRRSPSRAYSYFPHDLGERAYATCGSLRAGP
jgi:hypothetical protein